MPPLPYQSGGRGGCGTLPAMPVPWPTPSQPEFCTTPDGVRIATYDFGGSGPDLVLVHANGFCADVLRPLADHLVDRFHCVALDLRGHGRSGRPAGGDFTWDGFATDVLTARDHLALAHPFGFGHSLGGASLLLAEQRRAGTFRSLYCFEPVVMPGGPTPTAEEVEQSPLVAGALRRRETFPSAGEAFDNFAGKRPFSSLDPDALRWYVSSGFELLPESEGGDGSTVRLRCRREDEAAIFRQGPGHTAFRDLPLVEIPVTLAYGERTDAFGAAMMEADAARLPHPRVVGFPGLGHFGPLERPDEVARSVLEHHRG